jgi:hypothetical protein
MVNKRKKSQFNIKCFIIAIFIVVVVAAIAVQIPKTKACTEEAKICPDGSAVGRIAPNCDFAPCPSCICPEGFMPALDGNYCAVKCEPNQMCPFITIPCSNNQTTEELCSASGGTVTTSLCCKSVSNFPNTCLIGACGCSPDNSYDVQICDCGNSKCWNGNECVTR